MTKSYSPNIMCGKIYSKSKVFRISSESPYAAHAWLFLNPYNNNKGLSDFCLKKTSAVPVSECLGPIMIPENMS